ncbi:hypothetical protein GX51_00026 [Blastomyces parvus]|uniref:Uncharacterized protein n=1 Tax=Blastomyces parvus TaxID=2060905 RepID=A0A2B7XMS3_9EURO|nr:hypothetical protein GX51_00026 [Blastomyces parvus]
MTVSDMRVKFVLRVGIRLSAQSLQQLCVKQRVNVWGMRDGWDNEMSLTHGRNPARMRWGKASRLVSLVYDFHVLNQIPERSRLELPKTSNRLQFEHGDE